MIKLANHIICTAVKCNIMQQKYSTRNNRYDDKIVTGNILLHSQYFYFMYIKLILFTGGAGRGVV